MKSKSKDSGKVRIGEQSSGLAVTSKNSAHKWLFPTRIRPNAFSWKSSRVAVQRIKEAGGENRSIAPHKAILPTGGARRPVARPPPAPCHVALSPAPPRQT